MRREPIRRPIRTTLLFALVATVASTLAASPGFTQGLSVPPAFDIGPSELRVTPEPAIGASLLTAAPAPSLVSATEGALDSLNALAAYNAKGTPPLQNGFVRPLAAPVEMGAAEGGPSNFVGAWYEGAGSELVVWGSAVRVADAHRLRLRLDDLRLPPGTRFLVYSESGEAVSFGIELRDPDGGLWTPSVAGPTAFLEVSLPAGDFDRSIHGFRITGVGEIVELGADFLPVGLEPRPAPLGECLRDVTCVNQNELGIIDLYSAAVAHLQFVSGGGLFVCSGGLLNDTVQNTTIPYLLTANHCFSSRGGANSLEAFWDYRTKTCNGNFPGFGSLPRSNGSELLVTSPLTDFTFVRLNSIPGQRVLLGWNANPSAVQNNTKLYRISHPAPEGFPFSQAFSTQRVRTGGVPMILEWSPPFYLYSSRDSGGVFGGSSGSPVILPDGQTVGQLTGGVGPDPGDGCNSANSIVDGAFSVTFPSIQAWLAPGNADTSPCQRNATTACLVNNRFEVQVFWSTANATGLAQVMTFGGKRAENVNSVFWWFFGPTNFEMGVKVLNACNTPSNRFWVFVSGLTDQQFVVVVRDTVTGKIRIYGNPLGLLPTTAGDTFAFACN